MKETERKDAWEKMMTHTRIEIHDFKIFVPMGKWEPLLWVVGIVTFCVVLTLLIALAGTLG